MSKGLDASRLGARYAAIRADKEFEYSFALFAQLGSANFLFWKSDFYIIFFTEISYSNLSLYIPQY